MRRSGGAKPALSEDQLIDENNFSEDEEALYVAANDSEIDSDPQATRRGQDLELSNVAVFRRAPAESSEAHQHAFHPQPAAGWPSQAFIPQDDRTLILFDLNGVLVHHTFNGRTHKHYLRPGAEELLRLVPHFRLGIYSSATLRTVQRAMAKLHEDLVSALPTGEKPPPGGFFEVVLCRDHCVLAKEVGAVRKGGKPWDTVKPLGRYFENLSQVVLVDDSPHKSLREEAENMLVMPVWAGPDTESGQKDAALPALVDGFLGALNAVQKNLAAAAGALINRITDIRPIVGEISRTLMLLHPPPPQETEDEEEVVGEDGGPATMVDGLTLNPSKDGINGVNKNRKSTPPPPGLLPPPPAHLTRSATRGERGAAAASIGAEAINHHAALYFLVLVKLKDTPEIPGASLFDINTLLQRRFMVAYSTLFKNSAKEAVKSLVDNGTLVTLETNYQQNGGITGSSGSTGYNSKDRGTRYALKKGIPVPNIEKLLEIEKRAQSGLAGAAAAKGFVHNDGAELDGAIKEDINALLISTIAELETRAGVSKDALDIAVADALHSVPSLQGWFGAHVMRDTTRKVLDTLRRLIQDALDAWCSSGDVNMVGLRAGGTPPSLFHVQITPQKGLKTVQNAVFDTNKLVEDAAKDVAVALEHRGIAFTPYIAKKSAQGGSPKPLPDPRRVEKDWRAGKTTEERNGAIGAGSILPVFEDRGTLTARAVPIGDGEASGRGQHTTVENKIQAAKETKKDKNGKKVKDNYSDDGIIDLTGSPNEEEEDDDLGKASKKKKMKIDGTATVIDLSTGATATTATGTTEVVLTRGQQKLAAMREKLGLPSDCGLTRAELKELVKEANREKQRKRDEEIQAAKAVKQRGAGLLMSQQPSNIISLLEEDDGPGADLENVGGEKTKTNNNRQLTPLHLEIAELAKQATPTTAEISTVQAAVHAVDSAARGVWPAARAVLFGSQATGLALPGGDLDIVVLGVGPQLQRAATGFTPGQRRQLAEHLEDLLDALRRSGTFLTNVQIIDAKIPIIKCLIQTSRAGPALPADISFGAINGAAAVTFLRRQILAVPPLRPLSLAVKAFLRDKGLNEVFTGGIGSYAVVNMVLAHLQREGFQADLTQADKLGLSRASVASQNKKVVIVDGRIILQEHHQEQHQEQEQKGVVNEIDDTETFKYLEQLAAASGTSDKSGAASVSPSSSSGDSNYDYGMLLWGFLERFSHEFDFLRQAISIRQGGFVKKGRWKQARRPWLLAVEDPQEPGKDICSGSFNINYVRDEFAAAAQMLAEVSEDAEANLLAAAADGGGSSSGSGGRGGAASITDKMPMLSLLMDVECAVGRTPAANAARRALEHRAEEARQIIKSRFQGTNTTSGQKRSFSMNSTGGGGGNNKRRRVSDPIDDFPPFPGYHSPAPRSRTQPWQEQQQQYQQQRHQQQYQQRPGQGVKGSGGHGGRARGSKGSRAVEAQWKDRRGQFMEYGDDGPDYRGGGAGGGGQESMQLQKFKGGRFSAKNNQRGSNNTDGGSNRDFGQQKKKKGIKRKPRASTGSNANTVELGVKKVRMKKRGKKKAAKAAAKSPASGGKKAKGRKIIVS